MPGINTHIGINKFGGGSSSSYWTQRLIDLDCLFFASHPTDLLSKVVSTQLPNQVTGSSDYLTVTGTGLNARYRTPNTAPYKTADSDYVFWKSDASESTCDGNRLIGYDFPRILVKYLNVAPYTILWIAVLKPGVTVTDGMRDAFDLSVWWDNTLSDHGAGKQNRIIGQSVWTKEYTVAYQAVYNSLTTKPSSAIAIKQDDFVRTLVNAGIWAKLDQLALFAQTTNVAGEAMKNWISPGTRDLNLDYTQVGPLNPFTPLEGFDGLSNAFIRTNYTPSVHGVNWTLNSASCGVYLRKTSTQQAAIYKVGSNPIVQITPALGGTSFYFDMNNTGTGSNTYASSVSSGFFAASRNGATDLKGYLNKTEIPKTQVSTAVVDNNIILLMNGNLSSFCLNQISFYFAGGKLTATEMGIMCDAIEAYMDSNGKGVLA